ncbi:MAG: PBP1A family penicillin-binding protein [Acidobacteria bacterium]|nr:PBP1A family penicillin-binding protein [Acidobacteriota bacterium]
MFSEHLSSAIAELRPAYARHRLLVGGLGAALALAALLPLVAALWVAVDVVSARGGLPGPAAIGRIDQLDQATAIFDDQDRLAFTIYKEQRIAVRLDQVSPILVQAILAIEDQRFYEHHGYDIVRMLSAAIANLRHQRLAQGASTITQQLARQSFLAPDKTLHRKIQELILASRIEAQFAKPQILEMYLNKVYFGDGLYGVEAAARGYFGRHASELTLAEAALVAGLVKSPSTYAPTVSPQRAVARRDVVLQAMLDNGAIDRAAFDAAKASTLSLSDGLRQLAPHGEYFKEEVRLQLIDRFGWERVYQGGLKVYTTLDMPMQEAAESAIAESMATLDARRQALARRRAARRQAAPVPDVAPLQGALIALDPHTGHVRAMVGGRDFERSHFNRAMQARRQPGSAFKPFVYAAALESGFTPATMIDHLDEAIETPQGAWTPEDGHAGEGPMSLRAALRLSSNRAAVQLLQEVGIPRTVEYAREMGVGAVPSVPSLALGSGEVTLASMTAAYAAFANAGRVPKVRLIRRVEDRGGHVLYEAEDEATQVLDETTAFLMSSMLADVVNAGTAYRARQLGFTLPAAGKTGTTNAFKDAWFIGYTPHLAAGVWIGFDQPQTILPNGFAADLAVPVWASFMKAATREDGRDWFETPDGVTTAAVCRLSGKLATEGCQGVDVADAEGRLERRSMVYTEYFAPGTAPTEYCNLHDRRGFFSSLAALLGGHGPAPPPAAPAAEPPPTPAIAPRPAAPIPEAPPAKVEKQRKRGFWARLLGIGEGGAKRSDDRKEQSDRR